MKSTLLLLTAAALTSCQTRQTKPAAGLEMPPYQGSAAFTQMTTLAGKWKGLTCVGPAVTEFRVLAGGSVVEEHFAAGTPMEMLSTYHDVNGKLTMTHYCALRNQPRMRLAESTTNSLTFDFIPTPGINPAKDMHMHGATYTFIDANHLKVDGVSWKDGKVQPGCSCIYTRL